LPFYSVSAVAEAVGMSEKQLDNMLSRNALVGVERKARGVARRISADAAVTINLASGLSESLRVPIGAAIGIATQLQTTNEHVIGVGAFLTLRADMTALRIATLARLDMAVEMVGRRRRGRPPRAGQK